MLGGAGTIQVRGLRTGTVVNLTAPGQRPTFSNTLNSTNVLLADRTHFAAAAVTGNTTNLLNNGLGFVSDQFVVVQDVDISSVGGVGVLAVDRNMARLIDVSVSNAPNGPAVALRNGNAVTIEGSRLDRAGFGLLFNNQNTVTVTGTSITNSTIDGLNVNSGNAVTVTGTTISGTGVDGIAFNNGNTISVSDTTLANIGVDAVFGINSNVVTLTNVSAAGAGQDFVDVNDFNTVTVSNSTATGLGGRAFLIDDANTLTVSGGQYSSAAEGLDADDGNAIALTDTSIASIAGQEGVDISDGNTFVMLRSTVSSAGNRVLEFSNNNNVTVNLSTLTGTPTNTVAYEGAGNVLSGTGNVDTSAPTVGFCFDAGGQTGTVGFTNGTTCP